jgi:hypothetical protein
MLPVLSNLEFSFQSEIAARNRTPFGPHPFYLSHMSLLKQSHHFSSCSMNHSDPKCAWSITKRSQSTSDISKPIHACSALSISLKPPLPHENLRKARTCQRNKSTNILPTALQISKLSSENPVPPITSYRNSRKIEKISRRSQKESDSAISSDLSERYTKHHRHAFNLAVMLRVSIQFPIWDDPVLGHLY